MELRTRMVVLTAGLLVTMMGNLSAQEDEKRTSIDVRLDLSKDQALDQVVTAFIDSDLIVTETDESVVTVGPYAPDKFPMIAYEIRYRANIIGVGDGSRVILSGEYRTESPDMSGRGQWGQWSGLDSKLKGKLAKAWQKLEEVAALLSGEGD